MSSEADFEGEPESIYHRFTRSRDTEGVKICCICTKTWCIFFAVVTLYYSSLDFSQSVVLYGSRTNVSKNFVGEYIEAKLYNKTKNKINLKETEIGVPPVLAICYASLKIITSLLLILGVSIKNALLLVFWLGVSGINIGVYLLLCTVVFLTLFTSQPTLNEIAQILFVTTVQLGIPLFCCWIVWLHRRHLLMTAKKKKYIKEYERYKKSEKSLNHVKNRVSLDNVSTNSENSNSNIENV